MAHEPAIGMQVAYVRQQKDRPPGAPGLRPFIFPEQESKR